MKHYFIGLALTVTSSLSFAGVASVTATSTANPVVPKASVAKPAPATCHSAGKYVIMERPAANGDGGTDLLIHVKKKASAKVSCPLAKADISWKIPNEQAQFYVGVVGDMLVLDAGTGPTHRDGFIWDLAKRKKVKTINYNDSALQGSNVLYWVSSADKVNSKNCPNMNALKKMGLTEQVIEYQHVLDLKTLKVTKTKKTRCSGIS